MPTPKNIIIFIVIATIFFSAFIFYKKKNPSDTGPALVSSVATSSVPGGVVVNNNDSLVAQEFSNLLLSVKNLKLDDAILSDPAFISLNDSSITLVPDGTEGRPNPFAPLGVDVVASTPAAPGATSGAVAVTCVLPKILDTATNTCVTPAVTCIPPKVFNATTKTCVNPPAL